MLDKKIFKKYDIRGIYPKEIDEEGVCLITQAVAKIFKKGIVIIGYDARLSSKKLYGALKKELANWPKLKIIEIGLVSTPALYFTVIDQKARGGIMITASHNPKEYNGMKVVGEKAEMMGGEYIWETMDKNNSDVPAKTGSRSPDQSIGVDKKYLDKYAAFLCSNLKVKKPLRVVFDCSNGPTGLILKKVFNKQKNITAKYINDRPDGNFPAHGPNPLEAGAMKQLQKTIKDFKADIGVVYDADGDRSFFVDNKGQILPSYLALYLLSQMSQPPVVADIITYEAMKYAKIMPEKDLVASKVGTRLVRETMKKHKAGVAGEFSCHFFFNELCDADSGILATAKILSTLSEMPYSLSDFRQLTPNFVEVESHSLKLENMTMSEKLITAFEKKYSKKAMAISKLDGITFEFPNGWLIVRPSNTEPILRIFIGRLTQA